MILRAEAPAKINRELRVGGRRADGFHEILSRFCTIDFSDRIEIETAETLELSCSGIPVPGGDSNLAVTAARALAGRIGITPGARIRLEKRVPSGAGLGGGSSDAAVTLLLLSRLWAGRGRLDRRELSEVAASVGSDVPFFLYGGEADVAGRGERVTPRADAPPAELVLLIPPFTISTAGVYAAYARSTRGLRRLPDRLDVEAREGFLGPNDLASAVLETKEQMVDYLASARRVSRESGITGSGSALVLCGVTAEGERELGERHPEATVRRVRTLGRADYERKTSP